MTNKNVINVCLCPGCGSLTTMKKVIDDTFFCKLCHQKFKQYKNGKLIYVPLPVAKAMEDSEIIFESDADLDLDIQFDFDPEDS
jgi:hypothetical protein